MLRNTLFETKQQICENHNFDVLLKKIADHIQEARDEYQLILDYISNSNLSKQLMEQTKLNKADGQSKVKQLNEHIATLQSQICVSRKRLHFYEFDSVKPLFRTIKFKIK